MIEYVSIDCAAELDAFVREHPAGHLMQTSLWGLVKSDWIWTGLICRTADGDIRGTLALLRHPMRLPHACLLYAPRGPICDPADFGTLRELVEGAKALGKRLGAVLLRMDPEIPETDLVYADQVRGLGFRIDAAQDFSLYQPRLNYVSDLRGKDEESLLASFHRSVRYNIRRARRGPLTVRPGTASDLPAFDRMMRQTAAKNGFRPRSQAYFRSVLDGLGDCAGFYVAELDGEPVAAAITAVFGRSCLFLYSCSDQTRRDLHANELLQWHMQTDALRAGCERFDFRGVKGYPKESNPNLGLHTYKQGFHAEFCAWIGQLDLSLRPVLAAVEHRMERTAREIRKPS